MGGAGAGWGHRRPTRDSVRHRDRDEHDAQHTAPGRVSCDCVLAHTVRSRTARAFVFVHRGRDPRAV
eukprot:3174556-Prymnesium_polylepis.2